MHHDMINTNIGADLYTVEPVHQTPPSPCKLFKGEPVMERFMARKPSLVGLILSNLGCTIKPGELKFVLKYCNPTVD